jgi:hypothetical protein
VHLRQVKNLVAHIDDLTMSVAAVSVPAQAVERKGMLAA